MFSSVFMSFGVFRNFRSKGGDEKFSTRPEGGGRKIFNLDNEASLTVVYDYIEQL